MNKLSLAAACALALLSGCGKPADEPAVAQAPPPPSSEPATAPPNAPVTTAPTATVAKADADPLADFAVHQDEVKLDDDAPLKPRATPKATRAEANVAEAAPQPASKPEAPEAQDAKGLSVVARVVAVSKVPDPSSVAYRDCLTMIKYKVVKVKAGQYAEGELLAAHLGMKDGKLMPAARYKVGQQLTLSLEPLDQHPDKARLMQADDTNEYSLTPFLVTSAK